MQALYQLSFSLLNPKSKFKIVSATILSALPILSNTFQIESLLKHSRDISCSWNKLKEHVAFDQSSWSLKSVLTVCYEMHMVRKML